MHGFDFLLFKNVLGTCHRFTLATEAGIRKGHDLDTKIAVVRPNSVKGQDSTPFVNVDPTTIHGLERAARMGLAESNLADAIVTHSFIMLKFYSKIKTVVDYLVFFVILWNDPYLCFTICKLLHGKKRIIPNFKKCLCLSLHKVNWSRITGWYEG